MKGSIIDTCLFDLRGSDDIAVLLQVPKYAIVWATVEIVERLQDNTIDAGYWINH